MLPFVAITYSLYNAALANNALTASIACVSGNTEVTVAPPTICRAVAVVPPGSLAEAQSLPEREVPDYVAPDGTDKVTFTRVPTLDEVPYPVTMEPNLVVEFYSR